MMTGFWSLTTEWEVAFQKPIEIRPNVGLE